MASLGSKKELLFLTVRRKVKPAKHREFDGKIQLFYLVSRIYSINNGYEWQLNRLINPGMLRKLISLTGLKPAQLVMQRYYRANNNQGRRLDVLIGNLVR